MTSVIDLKAPCECLTPAAGHYFYGYYDNPAWSGDEQYHLCHKVNFWDRLPTAQDEATLGVIHLATKKFMPLAKTTAWNFQQGSMLQWHPKTPNEEIIFNRFQEERFVGVVRNVRSGTERLLPDPVANVDPTGRYGLSINFSRIYDFRAGYGYPHLADPGKYDEHPADDGVRLMDLTTGQSELILTLRDVARMHLKATASHKLVINHITFNTEGTRFVFLPRTFGKWQTAIVTSDLKGNCFSLRGYAYASHYHWRDPRHILFHSGPPTDGQLRLLADLDGGEEFIDPAFFTADGHCSYSPDRRWLLYDSYPIDGYRYLYLYDLATRRGMTLGGFLSASTAAGDFRCDLHPRWNRRGTAISFDSTHEGRRGIYRMDLTETVLSAQMP